MNCIDCNNKIAKIVFDYSIDNYRYPLCRSCQNWFREKINTTSVTNESADLYFELRKRGVEAELEEFDGIKTVDIVVHEAKLHIEVDGMHHSFNADQALSDLKRSYNSFKQGYLTLRIPNSLIRNHIDEAASLICSFVTINEKRERKNKHNY